MAFAMPVTPFVRAPSALNPTKMGINGMPSPRTFGIAKILGILNLLFPPRYLTTFLAPNNADLMAARPFLCFFFMLFFAAETRFEVE